MTTGMKEYVLGAFLLVVGAFVLGASPVFVGEAPDKWEIGGGSLLILMGAWLVSPDGVTERLNEARDAIPFLQDTHTHDDE